MPELRILTSCGCVITLTPCDPTYDFLHGLTDDQKEAFTDDLWDSVYEAIARVQWKRQKPL